MKFVVYNLGCKVNQYEGLSMMKELVTLGHSVSDRLEFADVYIINTCAVTAEAEAKSRRFASRASRLNPQADVLIVGCSAQINPNNFAKNVKILGGVASKNQRLLSYISNLSQNNADIFQIPSDFEEITQPNQPHARNYIKIQDGCNNFCSYCIVPYARGRSRSRLLQNVLIEVNNTQSAEIIFSGINMSAYCDASGNTLVQLVGSLKNVQYKRFRISSLEPNIISRELLEAWSNSPMCPHFHLSMQSGSNEILHKMNRHYTAEIFLKKIELIREFFPLAAITTDCITGFPTETDNNHAETLNTILLAKFADIHVFPYSERAGTEASKLPMVDMSVRRQRASEVSALASKLRAEYISQFQNVPLQVLAESATHGTSENYIRVKSNFKSIGTIHTISSPITNLS